MTDKARVEISLQRTTLEPVLSCYIPLQEEVHYQLHDSSGQLAFSKSIILMHTHAGRAEHLDVSILPHGKFELSVSVKSQVLERIPVVI